ncbi:arginine deiminase [Lactobacillus kefiranofaciens]|uniref:arginine deiminase n=1 Tax=Lactobacillus kefiranofaciens TaxID=267818 RepID=UPI0016659121|nr:arginine deiminase [Lactobacillus kefiranofaciens]MCJ2171443.1 arginine deiminase [Lactobacillus kefiranofaciens]QNT44923.1 arginine deiminase [Lactobacillus kefiranofaciens]
MADFIHVYSEIGKLKTVLLHRPEKELENLSLDILNRMLIDDIPYLKIAQEEHDYFADTLKKRGIHVVYLEDLLAASLINKEVRIKFLDRLLEESGIKNNDPLHQLLMDYLLDLPVKQMVSQIIAGVKKAEIKNVRPSLADLAEDPSYPFYLDPMPNVYFMRDQQAAIGNGMTINRMTFRARRRESLFMESVLQNHPDFKDKQIPVWRDRYTHGRLEGGDELVLNKHVLAIGISQRTSAAAITDLAHSLFGHSSYDTILAIKIPHNHAMMHLDTVFTMINYDQFTVHPFILDKAGEIEIYVLQLGKNGNITITPRHNLVKTLKEYLNLSGIDLIPTGGGDSIAASREQWNDGSNTLAIAPGEVVTYDRNYVSNDLLRKHGILVHEIRSSELSRGRGGPRCMSCPLVREDL